jgi:hypothetical protein
VDELGGVPPSDLSLLENQFFTAYWSFCDPDQIGARDERRWTLEILFQEGYGAHTVYTYEKIRISENGWNFVRNEVAQVTDGIFILCDRIEEQGLQPVPLSANGRFVLSEFWTDYDFYDHVVFAVLIENYFTYWNLLYEVASRFPAFAPTLDHGVPSYLEYESASRALVVCWVWLLPGASRSGHLLDLRGNLLS